jgi:hypothetical protein
MKVSENYATDDQSTMRRHDDTHFERTDINYRRVFIIGVSVIAGVWVVSGLMFAYFVFLKHLRAVESPPPLPIALHGNPLPPEPRLQRSPSDDLKAMRISTDWQLNHYGWVDEQKGIVSLPIERAMEIVAQRGIPPERGPAHEVLSPPQAGTRETGFEGKVEPEAR